MKYLIIMLSIFLMFSCYEEEVDASNPLLVNQCQIDDDCQERVKPECQEVFDNDNETKRFECVPHDCFGWTGTTGDGNPTIGYYKDLEKNCYKYILENQ